MFWIGKEAEGRLKGLPTLFIVGDQTKDVILSKLQTCGNNGIVIGQLYFGAGHQSTVTDFNVVRTFLEMGYFVTLEVFLFEVSNLPTDIRSRCHIMATISENDISLLKDTDTIKLESDSIILCSPKGQFIQTELNEYNDITI